MTGGEVARLALKASLFLMVFAAGLRAEPRHATCVFKSPSALARMFLSMFLIMPAIALVMNQTFNLHPAVRIALVALALSPLPPVMPGNAMKVSSATDYTIGLLVTASILSVAVVPLAMQLLSGPLGFELSMSPAFIATQMLIGVLAPLAAGMLVRRFAKPVAERIAKPASSIATLVLVVCLVIILVSAHRAVLSLIGNGTLFAFVVFIGLGLATGYLLGGPEPERRSVLAVATSARHPGIAIAMAQENFPDQKLAPAAVLLCVVLGIIVMIPYKKWVKSRGGHARV